MKYKNFLSAHFWLWFVPWIGLLIFSLCLFLHEYEIGKYLLSFCGTSIIALLTAMAAFNNMDINEQKKRARDEYLAYVELLQIITERYYILRDLIGHSNRNNHVDVFFRGVYTPYIIPVKSLKQPDFGRFYFLSRKLSGKHKVGEEVAENLQAFNIVYYTQLERNLNSILHSIERKNELYETEILPVLSKLEYLGSGTPSVQPKNFSGKLSFLEFTNFLQLSEDLNNHLCILVRDYLNLANCLNKEARDLFDDEIINENGGFTTLNLPDDDSFNYVPLSKAQLSILNGKDYP
ncbi:TPA: hypothetical protein NKP66_004614 [Vibrio parahaemolyticus]|nr:hypothetical protein [Vibrio parahaemolyticus]